MMKIAQICVKFIHNSTLKKSYFQLKVSKTSIIAHIKESQIYQIIHLTFINIASIYKTENNMKKTMA